MSGNQLAKFFATVGFKVDTSEFDRAVKKVKKDVAGISKSVQSSTVAKQARSIRQNLRFEEQKAQYRKQEEAAMLKQAAFLNREDTYKKKGIALREKAVKLAERVNQTESVKALRAIQAKRQQIARGEIGSAKELAAMNAHYRKQEQAYDRLHQQALRENIKLEQRRTKEANRRTALQQRGARSSLDSMTTGAVGGMTARGAVSGLAAGAFGQQSFRTAQFSTAREPQFEFLTGSKEKAKEQIQFIDKEVDRLSLNLGQANEQYKNLLAGGGDAIGIEKTQKLFTSFSELSTMLGTSTDQQNRGLRAFTQMLSKGQVMAEELKGQ